MTDYSDQEIEIDDETQKIIFSCKGVQAHAQDDVPEEFKLELELYGPI